MRNFIKTLILLLASCAALSGCTAGLKVEKLPESISVSKDIFKENFSVQELSEFGGNVEITYSAETGLPKEINGKFSSHCIITEQDAVIAMGSVRGILKIQDFSFSCVDIERKADSVVFHLVQLYKGVPVMGSDFLIGAQLDGTPLYIRGSYINDIDVDVSPAFDAKQCMKSLSLSTGDKICSAKLVIYIDSDVPVLCWRYHVESVDPLRERMVYCEAGSCKVIAQIPLAIT